MLVSLQPPPTRIPFAIIPSRPKGGLCGPLFLVRGPYSPLPPKGGLSVTPSFLLGVSTAPSCPYGEVSVTPSFLRGGSLQPPPTPRCFPQPPPPPEDPLSLHPLSLHSHSISPVVRLGPPQHAVPPLRLVLDLLEEIRGAEDPHPAGGSSTQRLGEPTPIPALKSPLIPLPPPRAPSNAFFLLFRPPRSPTLGVTSPVPKLRASPPTPPAPAGPNCWPRTGRPSCCRPPASPAWPAACAGTSCSPAAPPAAPTPPSTPTPSKQSVSAALGVGVARGCHPPPPPNSLCSTPPPPPPQVPSACLRLPRRR